MTVKFPAIPRIKGQTADVKALIEIVETFTGARNPQYAALTAADRNGLLADAADISQENKIIK